MGLTPAFKLIANGKDVTSQVSKSNFAISFKDELGTHSDELRLQIGGAFKRPKYGDELKLYLGYRETDLFYCGIFVVQTTERINNFQLNIAATGTDFDSKLKEKRNIPYKKMSIYQICNTIAERHNLKLKCDFNSQMKLGTEPPDPLAFLDDGKSDSLPAYGTDLSTIFIDGDYKMQYIAQNNESDLAFLKRLAAEYSAIFSIKNQTLIFLVDYGPRLKEDEPIFKIDVKKVISINLKHSNRTLYRSCEANWRDTKENEDKKIMIGTEAPTLVINGSFSDENEARLKSSAKLRKANSGLKTGSLTLIGGPIFAGRCCQLSGNIDREDDGLYKIKSVNHNFSSNSYTTSIDITS